jgi:hypothetical protein
MTQRYAQEEEWLFAGLWEFRELVQGVERPDWRTQSLEETWTHSFEQPELTQLIESHARLKHSDRLLPRPLPGEEAEAYHQKSRLHCHLQLLLAPFSAIPAWEQASIFSGLVPLLLLLPPPLPGQAFAGSVRRRLLQVRDLEVEEFFPLRLLVPPLQQE